MNKVLFINACVRPESRTCRLAREVLKRLPGEPEELRLYEEPIEPLDPGDPLLSGGEPGCYRG